MPARAGFDARREGRAVRRGTFLGVARAFFLGTLPQRREGRWGPDWHVCKPEKYTGRSTKLSVFFTTIALSGLVASVTLGMPRCASSISRRCVPLTPAGIAARSLCALPQRSRPCGHGENAAELPRRRPSRPSAPLRRPCASGQGSGLGRSATPGRASRGQDPADSRARCLGSCPGGALGGALWWGAPCSAAASPCPASNFPASNFPSSPFPASPSRASPFRASRIQRSAPRHGCPPVARASAAAAGSAGGRPP
jgi:hypothetical protein